MPKDRTMRTTGMMVLALLIILSGMLVDCACSDPAAESGISFGVPFNSWSHRQGPNLLPDSCAGPCVIGSFDSGLDVVLISERSICCALTQKRCTWTSPYDDPEEGTRLKGSQECFAAWSREQKFLASFAIAVIGMDPAKVRLVTTAEKSVPLSENTILKARQLVKSHEPDQKKKSKGRLSYHITHAPPKVINAGKAALIVFQNTDYSDEDGPAVLFLNNKFFLLRGNSCTGGHVFFFINDRLHLTYDDSCCACGWWCQIVYDLSSGTPKQVYENGKFSD